MPKISTIWMRAAVLGSLWAGNEIIVGSFLHNLRVPMSGTFLALVSIALMSGFLSVWRQKGLVIRAGLIAALMKSISPSAIIMGPMIGILSEALMMELMISLIGARPLGILLGGMMGVFSTFIQKVITILVVYGFDFVILLENMFRFAIKQLRVENLEPLTAIWLLALFYLVIGLSAAAIGLMAGRRSQQIRGTDSFRMEWDKEKDLSGNGSRFPFLLLIHPLVIIACLYLLNTRGDLLSFSIASAYVLSVLLYYKNSLRRLRNLMFWVQMLLLVVVTAVFWKWYETGTFFSTEGLWVGARMMLRALVVMMGFSAVSVELRNPLIKRLLIDKGFSQLYASLSLAFSALPTVLNNFVQPRTLVLRPVQSLASIISHADKMYAQFEERGEEQQNHLFIVAAPINSGKTTFVQELIRKMQDEGIAVDGLLSIKQDLDQPKKGYELIHIASGEKEVLCNDHPHEGALQKGPFYFFMEAFEHGKATLSKAQERADTLIVVDEIGPLELKGRGWADALPGLIQSGHTLLLVVREPILDEFIEAYSVENYTVLIPQKHSTDEVLKQLKKSL